MNRESVQQLLSSVLPIGGAAVDFASNPVSAANDH